MPTRRAILLLTLLVLAVIWAWFARSTSPPPELHVEPPLPDPGSWSAASAPHVVVYLVDTLRVDHLESHGYPGPVTPHLARFARSAVSFERTYASSSWTKPSVATLLTSLPPSRHGAIRREDRLRRDVPTLPEILGRAGYATAAFVTNPNVLPVFGFERGFDRFTDIESVARTARARQVHSAALEYLQAADHDAPQFVYLHTRDPHSPYEPPPTWERLLGSDRDPHADPQVTSSLRRYDGEIAYADTEFGIFLRLLERAGFLEDSLFLFLSDHGEEFGEHDGWFHGRSLFEEQLRVPFLLRLPGRAHGGRLVSTPVRLMDVLPTITDQLGIDDPVGDGRSLLRLVTTPTTEEEPRTLLAELDHDGQLLASLVQGRHKLIAHELPQSKMQLFDLSRDAREIRPLGRDHPDFHRLQSTLEAIRATHEAGLWIELVNRDEPEASGKLSGRLVLSRGTITRAEATNLDEGDRWDLDDSRRELRFQLALVNRPNPIGQRPAVLVDVDRVRLDLSEDASPLLLEIDGNTFPEAHLVVGEADTRLEQRHEIDPTDPRLVQRSLGSERHVSAGLPAPRLRVYRIEGPAPERATIDEGLAKRLRDLGYLE